ncbi:MAG: PAS domain-containing protein [Gemmatimonadetes bacterium]|nr:PAS domain-containing protein [Gemmatimonadota bacterium]
MELTKALDHVSDGVVALDAAWNIAWLNTPAELLLRRRGAELVGAGWWRAFPYLADTPAERELRDAAAGDMVRRVRVFHSPLYAWHEMTVIPSAGGTLLVIRDVTDVERMKQRQAVREAVREVIDRAPMAISVTRGPEHRIELMNEFARRLLGGRDLEGLTVRNAVPEVAGQGLFEILDRVYATGQPFEGTEIPIRFDRLGDGEMSEGVFNIVYQPTFDVDGSVSGVLSISVDVTDLVRHRQAASGRSDA